MPAHEAFRRKDLVASLADSVAREAEGLGELKFMHVCGTHERSVNAFGLRSLLPPNLKIVAGPGCPVCVCPVPELLAARSLALRPGATLASFGDMLGVPMPGGSLLEARREGASLRLVYSAADALALARADRGREIIFLSVGFETTTAPTAALLASLEREAVPNFSVLSANRLVPEALRVLLEGRRLGPEGSAAPPIDGLILPGHVAAIVGSEAFRFLARDFGLPCVVAGFEPVDLLEALRDLIAQKRGGRAELGNGYSRAVRPEGNLKAKALMAKVYEVRDAEWRGLGFLPGTGLALRPEFAAYDASSKYRDALPRGRGAEDREPAVEDSGCLCSSVILGRAEPEDCPRFGSSCAPGDPFGPCMVSEEGTCRIRFDFGGAA
jgi:hydrogenase expression/formation protein HypD